MHVVTSGSQFLDIDGFAGSIAYAELLRAEGEEAIAACSPTVPLNESIPPSVRQSWGAEKYLEQGYQPDAEDTFTLIDVSDPSFFDVMVDDVRIVGIIDHHPGFEGHWWERLGDDSTIEPVGAACTLVYERWKAADKLGQISTLSARLLMTGILDNTLNFRAEITTDRDHAAFNDLQNYSDGLGEDWAASYFSECQAGIEQDLPTALRNDTKTMKNPDELRHLPKAFGQLVIWNAQDLLTNRRAEIAETLAALSEDWAINVVSIEEGKSYLIADNPMTQAKFGELMGLDLSSGTAAADRLWLRKEILKRAQQQA